MKKYREADEIRKRIIMKEVAALNQLGSSSEITDRQCFLVYWCDNNNKYDKKRNAFSKCWEEAGVSLELLNTKHLIRLCNMVYNPSFKTEINDAVVCVPTLKI